MVTTGILPLQGKIPMVEPGIKPGTSWLVVRTSDHQTTRLVKYYMCVCFSPTVVPCFLILSKSLFTN